jgi:hypothetical protein
MRQHRRRLGAALAGTHMGRPTSWGRRVARGRPPPWTTRRGEGLSRLPAGSSDGLPISTTTATTIRIDLATVGRARFGANDPATGAPCRTQSRAPTKVSAETRLISCGTTANMERSASGGDVLLLRGEASAASAGLLREFSVVLRDSVVSREIRAAPGSRFERLPSCHGGGGASGSSLFTTEAPRSTGNSRRGLRGSWFARWSGASSGSRLAEGDSSGSRFERWSPALRRFERLPVCGRTCRARLG